MPYFTQKYLLPFFFIWPALSVIVIDRSVEVKKAIFNVSTTVPDLKYDGKRISSPLDDGLQKRSTFSRFMNSCPEALRYHWSMCVMNVPPTTPVESRTHDNKEYVIICDNGGPSLSSHYGRCSENEICVTRGDSWPLIPNHTWAYRVSHDYYITLIHKGGSQQQTVTATQLGLPSGGIGTAAYVLSALVIDSSTQTSINVTNLDVVATVGRGSRTTNLHCNDCDSVVIDKVPERATGFILGVSLNTGTFAGQIVLDVWKR